MSQAEPEERGREPSTAREAAAVVRRWKVAAPYAVDRARYDAMAEVLDAFGDAPLPKALVEGWRWT